MAGSEMGCWADILDQCGELAIGDSMVTGNERTHYVPIIEKPRFYDPLLRLCGIEDPANVRRQLQINRAAENARRLINDYYEKVFDK